MKSLSGKGKVHAFEPTPETAVLLRRNLAANLLTGHVPVVENAVADSPGVARFSVFPGAQGNQLAVRGGEQSSGSIEVEVTSLDTYFGELGWPRVDLIKMDIEGAEIAAMRGMADLVRRSPQLHLIFEFHRGQMHKANISGADLTGAVLEMGFNSFETLFRNREPIRLPDELDRLERMAQRANPNLLAWGS